MVAALDEELGSVGAGNWKAVTAVASASAPRNLIGSREVDVEEALAVVAFFLLDASATR